MLVLLPGAALATGRYELCRIDPHGRACLAAIAIGPISKNAAAAKTVFNQLGVDVSVNQMGRRGNLRACLTVVKITARVGRSGIKLQSGKRQILEMCHESSEGQRGIDIIYTDRTLQRKALFLADAIKQGQRLPMANSFLRYRFFHVCNEGCAGDRRCTQ